MRLPSLSLSGALASLLLALPAAGAAPAEPPIPSEWRTPAEAADFRSTPSYDETLAFLKKLQERLPEMSLRFYGTSGEGRPLPLVIVSKEKIFSPEGDEAGERYRGKDRDRDEEQEKKPVVLLQNSIHAGEI